MFKFFWSRSASVCTALAYAALGLILFLFPGMSGTVFCWILSGGALAYALNRFWCFYQARKTGCTAAGTLTIGLLFAGFSVFCFARPNVILSFLPVVLGIVLLADGIGKLPIAVEAFTAHSAARLPLGISTFIPMALGVLIIANPFGAAKAVIMFFGASLLLDGILDLIAAIQTRRAEKSEYKDIR